MSSAGGCCFWVNPQPRIANEDPQLLISRTRKLPTCVFQSECENEAEVPVDSREIALIFNQRLLYPQYVQLIPEKKGPDAIITSNNLLNRYFLEIKDTEAGLLEQIGDIFAFSVDKLLSYYIAGLDADAAEKVWNERFPSSSTNNFVFPQRNWSLSNIASIRSLHLLACAMHVSMYLLFAVSADDSTEAVAVLLGPNREDSIRDLYVFCESKEFQVIANPVTATKRKAHNICANDNEHFWNFQVSGIPMVTYFIPGDYSKEGSFEALDIACSENTNGHSGVPSMTITKAGERCQIEMKLPKRPIHTELLKGLAPSVTNGRCSAWSAHKPSVDISRGDFIAKGVDSYVVHRTERTVQIGEDCVCFRPKDVYNMSVKQAKGSYDEEMTEKQKYQIRNWASIAEKIKHYDELQEEGDTLIVSPHNDFILSHGDGISYASIIDMPYLRILCTTNLIEFMIDPSQRCTKHLREKKPTGCSLKYPHVDSEGHLTFICNDTLKALPKDKRESLMEEILNAFPYLITGDPNWKLNSKATKGPGIMAKVKKEQASMGTIATERLERKLKYLKASLKKIKDSTQTTYGRLPDILAFAESVYTDICRREYIRYAIQNPVDENNESIDGITMTTTEVMEIRNLQELRTRIISMDISKVVDEASNTMFKSFPVPYEVMYHCLEELAKGKQPDIPERMKRDKSTILSDIISQCADLAPDDVFDSRARRTVNTVARTYSFYKIDSADYSVDWNASLEYRSWIYDMKFAYSMIHMDIEKMLMIMQISGKMWICLQECKSTNIDRTGLTVDTVEGSFISAVAQRVEGAYILALYYKDGSEKLTVYMIQDSSEPSECNSFTHEFDESEQRSLSIINDDIIISTRDTALQLIYTSSEDGETITGIDFQEVDRDELPSCTDPTLSNRGLVIPPTREKEPVMNCRILEVANKRRLVTHDSMEYSDAQACTYSDVYTMLTEYFPVMVAFEHDEDLSIVTLKGSTLVSYNPSTTTYRAITSDVRALSMKLLCNICLFSIETFLLSFHPKVQITAVVDYGMNNTAEFVDVVFGTRFSGAEVNGVWAGLSLAQDAENVANLVIYFKTSSSTNRTAALVTAIKFADRVLVCGKSNQQLHKEVTTAQKVVMNALPSCDHATVIKVTNTTHAGTYSMQNEATNWTIPKAQAELLRFVRKMKQESSIFTYSPQKTEPALRNARMFIASYVTMVNFRDSYEKACVLRSFGHITMKNDELNSL